MSHYSVDTVFSFAFCQLNVAVASIAIMRMEQLSAAHLRDRGNLVAWTGQFDKVQHGFAGSKKR